MTRFEQPLWGYELTYPGEWVYRALDDVEGFAPRSDAFNPSKGDKSGHLLIQAEWNAQQRPIEPLWKAHIGRVAVMLGAKNIGSAPWSLAGAMGFEAELVLPKKEDKRLWVGFLAHSTVVLKFMLSHPLEQRPDFDPVVTEMLKSLEFIAQVEGLPVHESGIPLPPDCQPMDPLEVLSDISESENWAVFDSPHPIDGLQAFYQREAPSHGWEIETFQPFPGQQNLGFARLRLRKGEQVIAMGLLPYSEAAGERSPRGRIAFQLP
jgi:hypothetical protein